MRKYERLPPEETLEWLYSALRTKATAKRPPGLLPYLRSVIKIYNLFNEDYRTVLQLPMPGINYSLLLRYDF